MCFIESDGSRWNTGGVVGRRVICLSELFRWKLVRKHKIFGCTSTHPSIFGGLFPSFCDTFHTVLGFILAANTWLEFLIHCFLCKNQIILLKFSSNNPPYIVHKTQIHIFYINFTLIYTTLTILFY